jgi:hypothetical protein
VELTEAQVAHSNRLTDCRKVWLPVALTALAVALRKHISVQGATSLIMFIVFVIETMMRLGLFKVG